LRRVDRREAVSGSGTTRPESKVVGLVALLLVVGVAPPSTPRALTQGALAIDLAVLAQPSASDARTPLDLHRSERVVDARLPTTAGAAL
jgi:hypothetical protein